MTTALTLIGLLSAVHLICVANYLSPKAPLSISLEVAGGFASAVGVTVAAFYGDDVTSLKFCAALALCLVLFSMEKSWRGKMFLMRMYVNQGRRNRPQRRAPRAPAPVSHGE